MIIVDINSISNFIQQNGMGALMILAMMGMIYIMYKQIAKTCNEVSETCKQLTETNAKLVGEVNLRIDKLDGKIYKIVDELK